MEAAAIRISLDGLHCLPSEFIEASEVYDAMKEVADMKAQPRREYYATVFLTSALNTGYPGNHPLCKTCFCKYHGISLSTFKRIAKMARRGRRSWKHGLKDCIAPRSPQTTGLLWVKRYAAKYGDKMPDTEEIHLPDFKWKILYRRMELELMEHGRPLPDYSAWKRSIKSKLPHLKIRKYKRFSKCDTCAKIERRISKNTGASKREWERVKNEHIDWQFREREEYYKHCSKSYETWAGKPKCITLSIDTMDHSKSDLPSFARDPKAADKVGRLHTHITGVLCHGVGQQKCYLYTWFDRFPSGSDVVNTIITDVISRLQRPLPPTLHLQMDNCWRENKNK